MSSNIKIGSARIGENGNIVKGKKGDQKQSDVSYGDWKGEVSMQEFYVHKKGWTVARPKEELRHMLGFYMVRACSNENIGYNQSERDGIYKYGTDSKVKTNCDCSSLVVQCIRELGFVNFPNCTTQNLIQNMMWRLSDHFTFFEFIDEKKTPLKIGDVLCTKTKGHTAIVVGE